MKLKFEYGREFIMYVGMQVSEVSKDKGFV